MEAKAKVSFVRITPRKMGMMADEIRGKSVMSALKFLQFSPRRKTADLLIGLVKSAAANADRKGTVDVSQLMVKQILVGGGPILKRFRARAKGSAFRINKRTSHVSIVVAEK